MKNKIKQISKRAISTLLSLLIILSVFPTMVFAANYITDMNSNAKFGVISGSLDKYGHEMHYSTYDGKTYIVFCVQYGKTSPDGSTYEYGKDFKKYVNREGATYEKIADYIAFGYTLQYGDGLPNTKEEWIAACCTQQYVWEELGVNPTRSSWNSTYMSDSLYKKWKTDTDDLIDLYYDKQISFNGDTKKINLGGSATLTDSNGVLKYYPSFTKTIDKVTFKHTKGENKLNISVADNCTTHSVKFNSASQKIYKNLPDGSAYDEDTTNYVYFDFDSGSVQNLMFSKKADPQTFKVDINVEFGNLKISKTSEDEIIKNIPFTIKGNGKQIAYEGAGFEIYDSNNHRISMQFTYPKVTTIHTFYTNSEGYLITLEKLPYGDYTLKEVQAPYGYVLDSTPIPFTVTQENSSTDTGVTVIKVKARDIAQKGIIEITKEGEIFSSVGMLGGGYIDENGNEVTFPNTYSPIYETRNLANAVFQIYAAEEIVTLDGTVRAVKGELVDEITTGKDGIAKSKELYLGKYTVIEKTAPDTFVNANEQYDIELTYAGQDIKVTSTALSVFNERQKVSVSLLKELSQDERFKLGTKELRRK